MKKLNLIPDGRDIDRIVDVMGNEIRMVGLPDGRLLARLPLDNNQELDTFTQAEWDDVLSWGTTRTLDAIAGTTYTVVNW